MRCRKVHSYLSAYCNDELPASERVAVGEHLSACSSCRKEESLYRSMKTAGSQINELKVSDDFNTGLLNRIAQERFAETRTKAYLPKAAPRLLWGKVTPVAVTACLAVLAMVATFSGGLVDNDSMAVWDNGSLNNSYLTVQPDHNPNLTTQISHSWSFSDQLARAERINELSTSLAVPDAFQRSSLASARQVSTRTSGGPYVDDYYKVVQVVRIYGSPQSSSAKEAVRVY